MAYDVFLVFRETSDTRETDRAADFAPSSSRSCSNQKQESMNLRSSFQARLSVTRRTPLPLLVLFGRLNGGEAATCCEGPQAVGHSRPGHAGLQDSALDKTIPYEPFPGRNDQSGFLSLRKSIGRTKVTPEKASYQGPMEGPRQPVGRN